MKSLLWLIGAQMLMAAAACFIAKGELWIAAALAMVGSVIMMVDAGITIRQMGRDRRRMLAVIEAHRKSGEEIREWLDRGARETNGDSPVFALDRAKGDENGTWVYDFKPTKPVT